MIFSWYVRRRWRGRGAEAEMASSSSVSVGIVMGGGAGRRSWASGSKRRSSRRTSRGSLSKEGENQNKTLEGCRLVARSQLGEGFHYNHVGSLVHAVRQWVCFGHLIEVKGGILRRFRNEAGDTNTIRMSLRLLRELCGGIGRWAARVGCVRWTHTGAV